MNIKTNIGFEIRSLSNLLKRRVDFIISDNEDDVTRMQGYIINYISRNEGADIFQRDIENEFVIRRSTATKILQLMEKNGLIERLAVLHDMRLKKIVLTPKASERRENFLRQVSEIEKQICKGLSSEEIESFISTINKIKINLQ